MFGRRISGGNNLPDIATLLQNGLTDIIGNVGGVNNSRNVNGTVVVNRPRSTLTSSESESGGIPIVGGFDPTHRRVEEKLTGFSRDSVVEEAENDPAYSLLNDRQSPSSSRNTDDDDEVLEQILRMIQDSNF